jgi:hypothetical protein
MNNKIIEENIIIYKDGSSEKSDKENKINEYSKFPISKNNKNCIGPCYPPNVLFYNPLTLTVSTNTNAACPIVREFSKDEYKDVDICNIEDISYDYSKYESFEDIIQIISTPHLFLKQIYKINNYSDALLFMQDSMDFLPIYSQRRIISSLFLEYRFKSNFVNKLFITKVKNIIKNIYNIKLHSIDIKNKILDIIDKENYIDLFYYLTKKKL